MSKQRTYWHFAEINNEGRPVMCDGTVIEPGKVYRVPEARLCLVGYHGSLRAIDALNYAPGSWVSKRTITGDIDCGDDKLCGTVCMHSEGIDATDVLRKFARLCALDVIDLWEAPGIVVQYLKTGDESIRAAAGAAAGVAARAAGAAWVARAAAGVAERAAGAAWAAWVARAAAGAAWVARAAAGAAARAAGAAQNRRLSRMLRKALKEATDE